MTQRTPFRALWVMATLTIVGGCATAPEDAAPTLQSLGDDTVQIGPHEQISLDIETARQTYEEFSQDIDDRQLNAKSMHRLADFEMQHIAQRQNEGGETIDPSSYDKPIRWYKELLANHPDYPQREEILYQLARAYEQGGQPDSSLKVLAALIRDYPTSDKIPEAYFRSGEMLFQAQQFTASEAAYDGVIQRGPKTPFYEQSLFKQGWAIYKQDRCESALNTYLAVLDLKFDRDLIPSQIDDMAFLSASDRELTNETFRAINLCLTQQPDPLYINQYLATTHPRNYDFLLFIRLGEHYLAQQRPEEAIEIFGAYYGRYPWHPYALLMYQRILDIYRDQGDLERLISAKQEYAFRYELLADRWVHGSHNNFTEYLVRSDELSMARAREHLRTHLLDLAQYHHAKAREAESSSGDLQAVTWYRRYLSEFPDSDNGAELNFLLAEALFDGQQYEEAAREYYRVAYDYPPHDKSKESAYAVMTAYNAMEAKNGDTAGWQQEGMRSALAFAKNYPDDPRTPAILTKAAEELYQSRRYTEAQRIAQRVSTRYAERAGQDNLATVLTVLGHSHFEQEHYDISELYYTELLAQLDPDTERHSGARDRLAASIYRQAEQLSESGAIPSAIVEFKRVASTVPESSIAPIAHYDAANAYVILDNWERALETFEAFATRYPDHELTASANEQVATAYLRLSRHSEAATALVNLAEADQDPELLKDSLWQAAELFEKDQDYNQAAATYIRYASQFPDPLEAAVEALNNAAQLYLNSGQEYEYRIQLQKIYAATESRNEANTSRTRYLAAKAAFELAEPHYERYAKVELVEPVRKNILLKNQYMKQALEAYNKAADLAVAEYTTAATYRIADMYDDFSRKLLESDRPADLTEVELEEYEILLEEQAFPFEEKAIALHQNNLERMSGGLYDQWIKKSVTALAQLVPARYNKVEQHDAVYVSLE